MIESNRKGYGATFHLINHFSILYHFKSHLCNQYIPASPLKFPIRHYHSVTRFVIAATNSISIHNCIDDKPENWWQCVLSHTHGTTGTRKTETLDQPILQIQWKQRHTNDSNRSIYAENRGTSAARAHPN